MNFKWDDKIPTGIRFKVTKTTKGRLCVIIGEHRFRKWGVQNDGTEVFRCSIRECSARVGLDPSLRRLVQICSTHNHADHGLSQLPEPSVNLNFGEEVRFQKSAPQRSATVTVGDIMCSAQETDAKMPNLVEAVQGFREGSTYYSVGDGFFYSVNRTKGTRKFLKCFRHGRYHCMARASFEISQRELSVTTKHNHAPEPWVDELLKERRAVKVNAARDFQTIQYCSFGSFLLRWKTNDRFYIGVLHAHCAMESIERFMEQRMEHFSDNNANSHLELVDQNVEHSAQVRGPRCEVTMNNQGGDKLHFNGYSYSKKAISANAIRWTCATPTRSVIRCKGAITTDRERPYSNPRSLVLHNHPPEDPEASIMRDIARAKRRVFRRKVYQHPFQFYPWMYPLQQLQGQSGDRERNDLPSFTPGTLEAALSMGGTPRADTGAGPSGSGYLDDSVKVKLEPEWVDAGALEPNCELEGQFDDTHDFNAEFQEDGLEGQQNDQNFSPMYSGHALVQQPTMVPDARDPVKLHVPGKPNLTITVAPSRPAPSTASSAPQCSPLNMLNNVLNRKRGRPRGSAYGSYNENEDRVTTLLTDSIIASQKMDKMERGTTEYQSPVAAAMSSLVPGRVKPRSKDPESIKAAQLVNSAQNRTESREELEKICLKLRQEVLALEVQNLKAERQKLVAYRRNIAVRREIMKLHLQLESGIPSDCASSGRGLDTTDTFNLSVDLADDSSKKNSIPEVKDVDTHKNVDITKEDPVPVSPSNQQSKISVRKSLQASSGSPKPSVAGLVTNSTKQPPVETAHTLNRKSSVVQERSELLDKWEASKAFSQERSDGDESLHWDDEREVTALLTQGDDSEISENLAETNKPTHLEEQDSEDDMSILDSVSPDLRPDVSVEFISDPGSRQWTQTSNYVEQERRFDEQFEGVNYENSYSSGGLVGKDPPESRFQADNDENSAFKRRRLENMWGPDDNVS